MSFKNILVPVDGSDTSLAVIPTVVEMAKKFDANVTVVQVMTIDPYIASEYIAHGQSNQLIERAKNYILDNLETAKAKFKAQDLDVQVKLLEGENIAKAIAKASDELNTDLIILCSHGRSGFKKLLIGSVAQSLITTLKAPVLIVKQDDV
ncbi:MULTISPECIES: universal stress protein [unclassified Acinetobacter]|uniref:universal stress protein n=1 Tax=unclassified Acinetobacter TaxID=196816 RepID=UPI002578C5AE|nr:MULTISPECIES: universal stress protein [unclassified Acinetobacter]MDM1763595.1 universal stress protein [Acinetobacter sp. 226-1]MDM1767074.1 universal stress protein [Acinetobacter sp. 226-4]